MCGTRGAGAGIQRFPPPPKSNHPARNVNTINTTTTKNQPGTREEGRALELCHAHTNQRCSLLLLLIIGFDS